MTEQFVDRKKLTDLFYRVAHHVRLEEQSRHISPVDHDYNFQIFDDREENSEFWMTGDVQHPRKSWDIGEETLSAEIEQKIISVYTSVSDGLSGLKIASMIKAITDENEKDLWRDITHMDHQIKNELTIEQASELCVHFAQALSEISSFSMQDVMDLLRGKKQTFDQQATNIAATLAL